MLIEVQCPNGHRFQVNEKHAGRIGACPRCSAPVTVPRPRQADGGLGGPGAFQHAPGESVPQAPRHDRAKAASDSSPPVPSVVSGKEKLCVACGKVVSQSFSVCTRCGTPLSVYRHLDLRKDGTAVVVQFRKHQIVDPLTVNEVAEELCSVADRAQHCDLVLDLSKMVGLSSLMLGKLVMLQGKMEKTGRSLKLRNVGAEIREVLAVTKLDQILHVEDGAEDAPEEFA